jgi:ATP-dependent Clp protease ATP-binding subunit ClpA
LGISRQAAHRRFRDLAPARRRDPLVATDAARRVVRLAQAEALAAGASPGSEHVLLGILRTDCEAARALRFDGVTPERARACVQSNAVRTPDGEPRHAREAGHSSSLPRILKQAARVALRRGDRELDPDPLLLAAVADPDGGARRTLTALSVEPASLRARLRAGTAQRPAVINA